MDWQILAVALLVTAAVVYLSRRTWRTWRGRAAGCGSCKCGSSEANASRGVKDSEKSLISAEDLTARLRRQG